MTLRLKAPWPALGDARRCKEILHPTTILRMRDLNKLYRPRRFAEIAGQRR
jgi:hypothetical protein